MRRKLSFTLVILMTFIVAVNADLIAQSGPNIHVVVNMVQLNVAVTDKKGSYVTGLTPKDFAILEDGILEKPATFAEGNGPTRNLDEFAEAKGPGANNDANDSPAKFNSLITGANVFVLFDTSDYMYRGFVFAQDSITEFIRSLGAANKIAFYSYSRDLSRAAPLTTDRSQVLRAVRTTVAGDEAALYNCLLLTLKDAIQNTGRNVVVVFSNGPDNSSVVPPEDVAEFAQSSGVSIYMVSTRQANLEPVSTAVFKRMTAATGGKAYFAKNWKDENEAFASIRDDLGHLYSLSYYPKPNPNNGWRTITVKLLGDRLRNCKVRTRSGYRPRRFRFSGAESSRLSNSSEESTETSLAGQHTGSDRAVSDQNR
jgi:Ca-activated chloride channel homolog